MKYINFDKSNKEIPKEEVAERHSKKQAKRGLKNISSTLALLILAPLLAIFITSHIFQSYEVDGESMESTLQNGDRLIVYKLPKTIANIGDSTYLPARGEIIVFDRPKQIAAPNSVKHLIKRVIALPGERITINNNEVTVYNKEFPDGFNPDIGHDYSQYISSTLTGTVDMTIGEGEVFVMGDNRTNSSDSRVFGPIPTNTIVGAATARFVPVGKMTRL